MKKNFLAIIFLVVVGGFFSACSSNPESLASIPSWYLNPKQNDQVNLYGVGDGFTIEEASNSALKNLAAKLMVTISSESTTLLEENKHYSNEEFREKISGSVRKIDFSNYKVSNSAEKSGKIYVEITVDRDDFIKDQSSKLAEATEKMSDLFKNVGDKSILEQRNIMLQIVNTAQDAELITRVLAGLNVGGIDVKRNLSQYNSYQNAYNKLLNRIEFYIEANDVNDRKVGNIIRMALNKEKLKTTKSKDLANKNLVVLEIKTDVVTNMIYGSYLAKVKADLALNSNQGKTLVSNKIELAGSSRISNNEAIEAAIISLNDQINKDGILKILSIEN